MPPTQAHHLCNSCKISTHVIHPGTPLMEPHRPHHQREHEYKPFLKFIVDTFIKNKEEYEKITEMGRNNDYIIGNLLDYEYFSKYYKLTAIDLSNQIELETSDLKQQFGFIGRIDEDNVLQLPLKNEKKQLFSLQKLL